MRWNSRSSDPHSIPFGGGNAPSCYLPTANETPQEDEEDGGAHLENRRKGIKNAKIIYISDCIFNRNVVVEAV